MAALKGLGPEVEKKIAPVLAMAKGLAKTESDGALTWVGETRRRRHDEGQRPAARQGAVLSEVALSRVAALQRARQPARAARAPGRRK